MRRHLLQFGAFLLLLVCLGGHVAETFDFWDHTLQTGNGIEYSLVIVTVVAGAVFGLAQVRSGSRAGSRPDCAEMLIGEVKEGKAELNDAARDPAVLQAALIRFGCCHRSHVPEVVKQSVATKGTP